MESNYPKTKGLTLSALLASILGISSIVSVPIPLSPVPITLQVFVVLLIAMVLGPKYGSLSCLIYLLFGTLGLPVFHGGTSGLPILLGPTGGFLFAFPVASFVGGCISYKLAKTRKRDSLNVCLGTLASLLSIYLIGITWLSLYFHFTLFQAFLIGGLPFIGFDALKAIVVIPIVLRIRWARMDLPVNRSSRLLESHMANGAAK